VAIVLRAGAMFLDDHDRVRIADAIDRARGNGAHTLRQKCPGSGATVLE
jgi:hypothetical protein